MKTACLSLLKSRKNTDNIDPNYGTGIDRCLNPTSSLTTRKWLRTHEVADYLGTSEGAIRNLVYRGFLRPRKFHNRLYFSREEIDLRMETSVKGGTDGNI